MTEANYYDEEQPDVNNNWDSNLHDAEGRLLDPQKLEASAFELEAEDLATFLSNWQPQRLASQSDGAFASRYVFPDVARTVSLKRLDIYQCETPKCQQATTKLEESRRIRVNPAFFPLQSMFFMDEATPLTKVINIESAGPPRRHRFRPADKNNSRDLTTWTFREQFHAFVGAERIPGTQEFAIDFLDTPDRYFISSEEVPEVGTRRLYRFGSYPVTQYYILEKKVQHECLAAEGGVGMTYIIEKGNCVFARKNWKMIGSFYGFDHEITSSNLYTIYSREDPFPRMIIAMGPIDDADQWTVKGAFYGFDVPVPGTCVYTLYHCMRSIQSLAATVPRHRLTIEDSRRPWDFRLSMYVFPAQIEDCTVVFEDPNAKSLDKGCYMPEGYY